MSSLLDGQERFNVHSELIIACPSQLSYQSTPAVELVPAYQSDQTPEDTKKISVPHSKYLEDIAGIMLTCTKYMKCLNDVLRCATS